MNAPFTAPSLSLRLADLRERGEVQRIESFVAEHRDGSVFHRPLWLQAIERGTGQRGIGVIAERAGILEGWLPLTEVHSPIFGRALVSSGFGVGGGALAAGEPAAVALCQAAEELAQRLSCSAIELRGGPAPDYWSHRSDSHCGFVRELEDDDEAQLLAITRRQRAEVRKGLQIDLDVRVGEDETNRAALYSAYAESVHNLGTPVFPRSLFDAVLDLFGRDADVMTVWHDGAVVSGVLSLYHKGAVMPFWGGGTFGARALRANDRLYYALMCHARERGCTHFDFGRSKTDSGPYHFKKNWGFTPEPLSYASWRPDGAAARDVDPNSPRHAARIAAWKRLPLAVANRIGPLIARGLG